MILTQDDQRAVHDAQGETWRTLLVEKTTGSSADTLLTGGLAALCARVLTHLDKAHYVYMRDHGAYYSVEVRGGLNSGDVARLTPFPLVRPLYTARKAEKAAARGRSQGDATVFDYDQALEASARYREARKALPGPLRLPEAVLYNNPELAALTDKPHPELPLYSAISGFKVADSVNELAYAWTGLSTLAFRELVAVVLRTFSRSPNDLTGLAVCLKTLTREYGLTVKSDATQLQIINPIAGKGANKEKANGVSIGSLDELWPLELLKVAGYLWLAAPLMVQGTKDRKTYILRPQELELRTGKELMDAFRQVLWATTAVKLDVLAALRFAQVLLRFRERRLRGELEAPETPWVSVEDMTALVQGFDVTLSKDLGSAVATMNLSTINLPEWLPRTTNLTMVQQAQTLLQEHLAIVRAIGDRGPGKQADEGAEEHELLRHYRDFVSARGDLTAFFRFTNAYGPYVLAQRDRNRRVAYLTTVQLEVLMAHNTSKDYREITASPGFRTIATCIRRATITAQWRASQAGGTRYEIRYGLGQELARATKDNEEFLIALGEFLRSYGAENARQQELLAKKHGGTIPPDEFRNLRGSYREHDLDEVVALTWKFGAELVGALLLAYGYARDSRDPVPTHEADDEAAASPPDETIEA